MDNGTDAIELDLCSTLSIPIQHRRNKINIFLETFSVLLMNCKYLFSNMSLIWESKHLLEWDTLIMVQYYLE